MHKFINVMFSIKWLNLTVFRNSRVGSVCSYLCASTILSVPVHVHMCAFSSEDAVMTLQ